MSSAAGAQRRKLLQYRADGAIRRDLFIGRDRGLAIVVRQLGRFAHAREMAIAGRAFDHDLGEGRFRLGMLAAIAERDRSLESRAGLGCLLGLPPFVAAPSRDRRHHDERRRHDIDAVPVPQLLELFAADFLVDFLEDIGHELIPAPDPRPPIAA